MYRLGCKVAPSTATSPGTSKSSTSPSTSRRNPGGRAQTPAGGGGSQGRAQARAQVRPRPYKRYGATVSKVTPAGTAHVTMNDDNDGRPFEVFVDIGKGGSDIKVMAEAIGRLASSVLRLSSPLSPKKVYEIVNQLNGIGGPRSLGFGKTGCARSRTPWLKPWKSNILAPRTAPSRKSRREPLATTPTTAATGTGEGMQKPSADLCPSCGNTTFMAVEGCQTCYSCGHSEC